MILLKPLSCQKFLYNISVTKTNEPQNDRAKVQIKYEKFIFIGVFFRLFCLLLFSLHNTTKKHGTNHCAMPNKRKPYSQNRN